MHVFSNCSTDSQCYVPIVLPLQSSLLVLFALFVGQDSNWHKLLLVHFLVCTAGSEDD